MHHVPYLLLIIVSLKGSYIDPSKLEFALNQNQKIENPNHVLTPRVD